MKHLITQIPLFWFAAGSLLTISAAVYGRNVCKQRTERFRQNLRCGDRVTLRTATGQRVKAQILKRNSAISFVAVEIDTRTHHLTTVQNLFRP